VLACRDQAASGGEYYGPDGFLGWSGHPMRAQLSARSRDADIQRRLWAESEQLTRVAYDFTVPSLSPHDSDR
jgi:hypothetical protein